MHLDFMSVLNYQGSKKSLTEFIHEYSSSLLSHGQTLLDIFSGTCSVGYSFKRTNRVYANDCEEYAYIISKALLGNNTTSSLQSILSDINSAFEINMNRVTLPYKTLITQETQILSNTSVMETKAFYDAVPTVWNGQAKALHGVYELFIRYYSTTYFGLLQAAEIDSLRFAIERYKGTEMFAYLLTALYFAMKECVFAKDGHMAQPLDIGKNFSKMLKQRKKSIFNLFQSKLPEFFSEEFVASAFSNKVFNLDFEALLDLPEIQHDIDMIYADPPYTDMQYSRYYHLLNFVTRYEPLPLTVVGGGYTKGRYTEGRYQSKLSVKSTCLDTFATLIDFSHDFHKNLIISFAYPIDVTEQKTDRYVMSIDSLINACVSRFGAGSVEVNSCDYTHTNNRNSKQKRVHEYLIACKSN